MTYYKPTDAKGLYRTLKTVYEYDSVTRSLALRKIKANKTFRVVEIVRYGTQYFLKTADKTYITADKDFVEKV